MEAGTDTLTPDHFIAHSAWRFADTMATIPHEYTVKETGDGRGTAQSAEAFDWFARYIQQHGKQGQFRDFPPQVYLTVGPYYYWTMGVPDDETIVINRALLADHDTPPAEARARVVRRARMFLQSAEASERLER